MSAPTPSPADGATRPDAPPADPSQARTGELIGQLSDQVSRLVRDEVRLFLVAVVLFAVAAVTQAVSR